MALHNQLGKDGEKAAFQFLEKKGYTILEKNWIFNKLEIDIIARDRNQLVIVEVKTRTINFLENPLSSITEKKKRNLCKAADTYARLTQSLYPIRYDIIIAIYNPIDELFEITHYIDAFRVRPKFY